MLAAFHRVDFQTCFGGVEEAVAVPEVGCRRSGLGAVFSIDGKSFDNCRLDGYFIFHGLNFEFVGDGVAEV